MTEQRYDYFGDIFECYFGPAMDECPPTGSLLVERLLTCTDDVQDRLAQARHNAMAWSQTEAGPADMASELFVITQCGLVYAAGFGDPRHALYYLATPAALFDPLIDQVEDTPRHPGAVVAVDRRCSHDLACGHPMDAALRRILDEHAALRVDLPG